MNVRAGLLTSVLVCVAHAGPPPTAGQLVGGLHLAPENGAPVGGELEVNIAALGIGIGAGLVYEGEVAHTVGLRLLLQMRLIGLTGLMEWRQPALIRWFDPFIQLSGLLGGGSAFRSFVAVDAGADFGLWTTPWHPVVGVRVRQFLGQHPTAESPVLLVTFGSRHLE